MDYLCTNVNILEYVPKGLYLFVMDISWIGFDDCLYVWDIFSNKITESPLTITAFRVYTWVHKVKLKKQVKQLHSYI